MVLYHLLCPCASRSARRAGEEIGGGRRGEKGAKGPERTAQRIGHSGYGGGGGGAETGVNLRYTDKTKKSGKKRSKLKEKSDFRVKRVEM